MTAPTDAERTETLTPPEQGWTCFHCGEHFPNTYVGQRNAAYHFGTVTNATPACKLDRKEKALLARLRNLEAELARYRAADTRAMTDAERPLPPSLAVIPNIPLESQTLEQLQAERDYWGARVADAPGFASAKAADNFRLACEAWIEKRSP